MSYVERMLELQGIIYASRKGKVDPSFERKLSLEIANDADEENKALREFVAEVANQKKPYSHSAVIRDTVICNYCRSVIYTNGEYVFSPEDHESDCLFSKAKKLLGGSDE